MASSRRSPVSSEGRATRAPVDWKWNCKPSYPDYRGFPIGGCEDAATMPPYIDRLKARIGTSGAPAGYQRFSQRPGGGCNLSGDVTVTGNWWVDCPNFGVPNNRTLTFAGGNVVFQNGLSVPPNATIRFNTANPKPSLPGACRTAVEAAPCIGESSEKASFAYLRNGDLDIKGTVDGRRLMVYLSDSSALNLSGGAGPRWSAPTEGPFTGLALWGEKNDSGMSITGGGAMALRGTFFLPHATLNISGGGAMDQQQAQFISYRLKVSGGAGLRLAPDPSTAVSLPPKAASLIR
ncbi:hypothetical protein BH23ACT2_BH23ACT2_25700 [soil metagenome]